MVPSLAKLAAGNGFDEDVTVLQIAVHLTTSSWRHKNL